jgi:hypothetical protein
MFQRDVARCGSTCRRWSSGSSVTCPARVGGRAPGPRLMGGVLFAVNPALRWERVPPGRRGLHAAHGRSGSLHDRRSRGRPDGHGDDAHALRRRHLAPLAPHLDVRVGRGRLLVDVEGRVPVPALQGRGQVDRWPAWPRPWWRRTCSRTSASRALAVVRGVAGERSARAAGDRSPRGGARGRDHGSRAAAPRRDRGPAARLGARGGHRASRQPRTRPHAAVPDGAHGRDRAISSASSSAKTARSATSTPGRDEPLTVEVAGLKFTVRAYRGRSRGAP